MSGAELLRRIAPIIDHEYTEGTLRHWTTHVQPPPAVIRAMAEVCGVAPGWLAFGGEAGQPGDYIPPKLDEVHDEGPAGTPLTRPAAKPAAARRHRRDR